MSRTRGNDNTPDRADEMVMRIRKRNKWVNEQSEIMQALDRAYSEGVITAPDQILASVQLVGIAMEYQQDARTLGSLHLEKPDVILRAQKRRSELLDIIERIYGGRDSAERALKEEETRMKAAVGKDL